MQEIRSIFNDERREDSVIYPIDMVLMVILLAKMYGCNTANEIATFYKDCYLQLVGMLPDPPGPEPERMISPPNINRIMSTFNADEINRLL